MTSSIHTFSVLFYIRNTKIDKNGKVPIYCRITVDKKRAEFSLKRKVYSKDWNSSAGKLNGSSEEKKKLNLHLDRVRSKITDHYDWLLVQDKIITARALKNRYLNIDEKKRSLLKVFSYNNDQMKANIGTEYSAGSVKNYFTTYKYVKEFLNQQYKVDDIPLVSLNYKFLTDFEYFIKTEKGNSQNGTMKHIQRLKKVVNVAIANDWLEKDPFLKYKCKFKKTNREFLTEDELKTLEKHEFNNQRLEIVRDLFVFACYTGYAYAEVSKLTTEDIITGIDGEKWIYTQRTKTNTISNVPLLPTALLIVEKYSNHPKVKGTGKLLPVMSNQKINNYLKEVAKKCEISKSLSFHIARHTFATTVTLTNGVPIETVSKMLGHNNIRTTQIYAKIVEKKVSEDMQTLKKKLYGS